MADAGPDPEDVVKRPSAAVMALETVSFHVDIYIKPSDLPAFMAAFQPAFDAVSKEPECTYFEVFQDEDDLGHLTWVENWNKSVGWFMENQVNKEYYMPCLAATEHLFVRPRQFRILRRMGKHLVVQKESNLA